MNNDIERIAAGFVRFGRIGLSMALLAGVGACSSGEESSGEGLGEDIHEEGFIELDSAAASNVGLEIVSVGEAHNDVLAATGTIVYDQNRVSRVGPRTEGRVVRIEHDLGDWVAAGTPLAVLESPDLGEAEAKHIQAQAELELARTNYEREESLFEKGISSRKEFLEARTEFERKQAALRAADARHRTLGATEHSGDSAGVGGLYTLSAPISGTVVERDLVLGQMVGPEDDLFTVADLARLWLVLDIYDADLSRVGQGVEVEVLTSAFPEDRFLGTLTYLGQVVDSITRTVKARVEIRNPDHRLRPGMFANAVVRGLQATPTPAVPEQAVQQMEGRTVVFVPVGLTRFEVRNVTVGARLEGDMMAVLAGLSVGEEVVSQGSFYLKSELLKESFGGDEH